MYNGKHALIVYDDLSKQATPTGRSPCCCAGPRAGRPYPGDVFYLHSRLLERAARVSDDLGGGSLTASGGRDEGRRHLGVLPTNVISITDGQIFLEKEPLQPGAAPRHRRRPVGVPGGGDAQIKAMKKAIGPLKLDLAQ